MAAFGDDQALEPEMVIDQYDINWRQQERLIHNLNQDGAREIDDDPSDYLSVIENFEKAPVARGLEHERDMSFAQDSQFRYSSHDCGQSQKQEAPEPKDQVSITVTDDFSPKSDQ